MRADPMDDDSVQAASESPGDARCSVSRTWDVGLCVFLFLALVAILGPHIVAVVWGLYAAALVAIVVCVTWLVTMPTTCMSGGLVCSLAAMAILLNTIAVGLAALGRFVFSLAP
jgi:hypothetical protein